MGYDIEVVDAPERLTAVVVLSTTWPGLPEAAGAAFDDVWAFLAGEEGLRDRGHNVILYKDAVPNVEVGVEVTRTFPPAGRVEPSVLPGGRVARTVHRGGYDGLPAAHRAVREWCTANGHDVAGPRWEIYGDWDDDPARCETEVVWLL
ncbi:MAG TPA: GyrI-like domain-containing protein [Acidimicrobiales bacterium]|nr:GyrI-like domain-containing protein [Acidimicrobiales bacterium]